MTADMPRAKQIYRDSLEQFLSAFGMSQDKARRATELQQQMRSALNFPHILESEDRSDGPRSRDPVGDRKMDNKEHGSLTVLPARGP